MDKHELLAMMFEECASHLDSLEIYKEYPDVSRQAIDDSKSLIQATLRELAKHERLLTKRVPDGVKSALKNSSISGKRPVASRRR